MTNFLFISPQYPQRLYFFADRLRNRGVNVLGIGDQEFWALREDLRWNLAEYCQTPLDCYDDNGNPQGEAFAHVCDAAAYLQYKHGKPDYIESFNEWWLPLDAALREKFDVPGVRPAQLADLTRKSLMKRRFEQAGIKVVPGRLLAGQDSLLEFLEAQGNDIVAKPDRGVGSGDTHRLRSRQEAARFFEDRNPRKDYFLERYVPAEGRELLSFDGLAGADGEPVFFTAHKYSDGIMEIVKGNPLSYWSYKAGELPQGLEQAGRAALRAFGLKKSFFHIEFFKTGEELLGLEINARPPGVDTLDMINHAKGMDCWDLYAALCAGHRCEYAPLSDCATAYAARIYDGRNYLLSHEQLLERYGAEITFHMPMDSKVMGDYAYLLKADTQQRCFDLISAISATRQN